MKKIIFKSASVFMMAVAAICFTACGSDDDSKNNPENGGSGSGAQTGGSSSQTGSFSESMLVGTWEGPVHVEGMIREGGSLVSVNVDYPSKDTDLVELKKLNRIEFTADHIAQEWDEKNGQYVKRENCNWALEGNIVKMSYSDGYAQELKLQSLDANSMVIRYDKIDGISDESYMLATYRRVQ